MKVYALWFTNTFSEENATPRLIGLFRSEGSAAYRTKIEIDRRCTSATYYDLYTRMFKIEPMEVLP